jgi:hypothetical protein
MTTPKARAGLARLYRLPESEADFQTWVIDEAHRLGWWVVHFRPARTERGWRTPVQGDAGGWLDLVLVRDRVLFAELKSRTGRLNGAERAWSERLAGAGAEVYLWRPGDRADITDTLTRKAEAWH